MAATVNRKRGAAPLLEVRHITQAYGRGERRFTAVQDVNIVIDEGDFVALLGPSGCGKSTLLRTITGLQQATGGQILYRGVPLRGVNPHATIVFQTFALFPWLTVQDNVEVALQARGVPSKLRAPRAVELLDMVGMDGFESAYPRELSGGMRQKVGFARALAVEPELLCLDEPFSALDVLSAEALRGELLELWSSGKIPTRAILMVSHNIEEAVFMADRIVVMDKGPGRVTAEMPILLAHPRDRKSFEFLAIVDRIYGLLAGETQPEKVEAGTAPGEPGLTHPLPAIAINDLAGLLERLDEAPGNRADIFRLTGDLGVDSDHLLQVTDAAELLGLVAVSSGDITLTPLGQTFADASILGRKEIFATRIRRLPVFRWAMDLLASADDHQLKWDFFLRVLELEFPKNEAERQLDTIVNWGRYAEVLAYDDDTEVIRLEAARGDTR